MARKIYIGFISLILLFGLITNVQAARTDGFWNSVGNYIKTTKATGYDILINGIDRYLNFGFTSGESGYGIRDNGGVMECKDSGGSWSPCQDGTGGGGGGSGAWATTTDDLAIYPVDTSHVVIVGANATTTEGYQFEVVGDSLFDAVLVGSTATTTGRHEFGEAIYLTPNPEITHREGLMYYDEDEDTFVVYNAEADVSGNVMEELWHPLVRNETGATITNGTPVYLTGGNTGNKPLIAPAQSNATSTAGVVGLATHDIEHNSNGYLTIHGKVRSLDTSAFSVGDFVYVSSTSAGSLTNIAPAAPNFPIQVGQVTVSNAGNGIVEVAVGPGDVLNGMVIQDLTINNEFAVTATSTFSSDVIIETKNQNNYNDFFNGTFAENFDALVQSDGVTASTTLERSGGGDLTMRFSDGDSTLDCSPTKCVIALTAGSDSSPQANYVYIPQSTKVLTVSTTAWPSWETEFIKVAFFFCPSTATIQTNEGCDINQNINDGNGNGGSSDKGHMIDITTRLRQEGARWISGVDPNGDSSTYLVITAGNVELKSTSGVIAQLHQHTFPAFDTSLGDEVLVKNWNGDNYHNITNLDDIIADSAGVSTVNKWMNLVVWGVANKGADNYEPVMINLPACSYTTQAGAEADSSGCDDFSMPREFDIDSGTGFLIARITVRDQATWTYGSSVDCRNGGCGSGATGGALGAVTDFADNNFSIFDETTGFATTYQLSGLSADREITMPDVAGTMCLLEATQTFTAENTFNATTTMASDLVVDTDTLFVDSFNDRVGIGTVAPQTQLHVETAGTASTVNMLTLGNPSGSADAGVGIVARLGASNNERASLTIDSGSGGSGQLHFTNGLNGTPNELFTILQTGQTGISTSTPWGYLSVEGQGTLPSFVVSDTANNTDLIVDASGNVGIGTASPLSLLHLGIAQEVLTMEGNNGGSASPLFALEWTNTDSATYYTAARIDSFNDGADKDGDLRFYTTDNTVNSEVMRLTGTKEVLIGGTIASDTDSELEIIMSNDPANFTVTTYDNTSDQSSMTLQKSDTDTVGIASQTDDGDNLGSIRWRGVDTGSNFDVGAVIQVTQNGASGTRVPADMILSTWNSTTQNANQLFLNTSGNIGVATSTPPYTLTVAGDIMTTGGIYDNNYDNGTSGQILSSTGAGIDWIANTGHDAVTLAGTPNYLTLSGQEITLTVLDISDDTNLTVSSPITLTGDDIGFDLTASLAITGDYNFGGGGIEIENNTALPGSCTVGQLFMDTDETSGQQLFGCEGGSFVLQGDGGGGGGGATTDGGAVTYVTSVTDDFAIGGTDSTAGWFFDTGLSQASTTDLFIGGVASTTKLVVGDGASSVWSIAVNADNSWDLSSGGTSVVNTSSTLGIITPGGVSSGGYHYAYDSVGETGLAAGAFGLIDLDTVVLSDTNFYSESAGTVTIQEDGYYMVTVKCDGLLAGGTREFGQCAAYDGAAQIADITCSMYGRETSGVTMTGCSATGIHEFSSGDTTSLRFKPDTTGVDVKSNGQTMILEFIQTTN